MSERTSGRRDRGISAASTVGAVHTGVTQGSSNLSCKHRPPEQHANPIMGGAAPHPSLQPPLTSSIDQTNLSQDNMLHITVVGKRV